MENRVPRAEYPRPDFDRSQQWLCLNGAWDFAVDTQNIGTEQRWQEPGQHTWSQQIIVPFAWESVDSHVGEENLQIAWYRRFINRPAAWTSGRTILHFGAVHYYCQLWLNGILVGEHRGGYLPFHFDVTDYVQDGAAELVIRVEAPADKLAIPHGKQRSKPADDYIDCCFTATSGIWQSVWLEERPATYITYVALQPTDDLAGIVATVSLAGEHLQDATLTVQVVEQPELSATVHLDGAGTLTKVFALSNPQLWSPTNPQLYHVEATLKSVAGTDHVRTYTGLRKIEVQGNRFLLNGELLFVRGVLDQGYWPTSSMTAPTDEALRQDVELTLAAGYNLSRKHIKFEDPRWLYWADRLGLLVWAEPPCFGRFSHAATEEFEAQLEPWVARDRNHPSIIIWGLYNEEWGLDWRSAEDHECQTAVERAYDKLAALDHSRPIVDDSGWWHVKTDILDWHYYDNNLQRWNEVARQVATDAQSWFGHQVLPTRWYETQLSVPGKDHTGLPLMNGEYGGGSDDHSRGWHLRWQTQELYRYDSMTGYIYTEFTDVEYELCGIYTAERQRKNLGCDPAMINAETVVIFDHVPYKPGLDYATVDGQVILNARIAHKGSQPLAATVYWGWSLDGEAVGSVDLQLAAFEVSSPIGISAEIPTDQQNAALYLWVIDQQGQRRAYGFVDASLVSEQQYQELQKEIVNSKEKGEGSFSETNLTEVTGSHA